MPERMRIAMVGRYARDYPRNALIRRAMAALGHEVVECRSRAPYPRQLMVLARKLWRLRERIDLVWVAEGGHELVPGLKLLTKALGVPLVFDPFTSRYNTRVEDRAYFRPGSRAAYAAAFQDWASCQAADHLVFDTDEHREYFVRRYRVRRPTSVIEMGADEDVFRRRPATPEGGSFEVLFYGTYIPLQGTPVIVRAAHCLREHSDIRFTLIGRGQVYDRVRWLTRKYRLRNVTLVPPMSPIQLADRIARADLCLGIFGATDKAARVVPNKVVQCAAMAKPMVTRASPAIARYFTDGTSIRTVGAGDPEALASSIEAMRRAPAQRVALGDGARRVFDAHFSRHALECKLQRLLRAVGGLRTGETAPVSPAAARR